jgi:glycosyltransferase involved in cell wall biosynthesis
MVPMRILLLTPRLPWPPVDGGRIAMARLAESLGEAGAEVEVLSLNPRKHRASAAASPLPAEVVDIDTSRFVVPLIRSASGHLPYVVARFVSAGYERALHAALRRFHPDVVQVESPFLMPYAEQVSRESSAIVSLRALNVEFRIWEGLARQERNPLRRLAVRRVAASLRRYEVRQLARVQALVPISDADADDFRALGCTAPIHVAPCSVPLPERSREAPAPNSVGFIGSLDFRPNQEAVRWIVDELWPRVTQRAPEARLSIAGSSPPEWLRRHARERGIGIAADVADAQAFVRAMAVVIAPLFAGGGMRIKVLEAMALAKPIVATAIGAGGIEARPGHDLLLAEDADAFADAVVRLLRDRQLAGRIGSAARAIAEERYDGKTIAHGLLRFYESLRSPKAFAR